MKCEHGRLSWRHQTALQNLRVVVEPLPRAILSAAMLRNQSSSTVNDDVETEAAEDTLSELRGHIPDNGWHLGF
jgi:hypothetical protein